MSLPESLALAARWQCVLLLVLPAPLPPAPGPAQQLGLGVVPGPQATSIVLRPHGDPQVSAPHTHGGVMGPFLVPPTFSVKGHWTAAEGSPSEGQRPFPACVHACARVCKRIVPGRPSGEGKAPHLPQTHNCLHPVGCPSVSSLTWPLGSHLCTWSWAQHFSSSSDCPNLALLSSPGSCLNGFSVTE